MKRQLWKTFLTSLGTVVALVLTSPIQAQVDREMFMMSYPNAQINVDGDASDWNLDQFGTIVIGGMNPFPEDDLDWERVTGTGDIAQLGWDDEGKNVVYGARWSGGVLPEEPADNSVKFYARDNATHQYFLVDIIDDEINTDDPEEAAWANDSVEFYIDPEDDGDPTDWNVDVQLVIDAANRVQVWNSPPEYEAQVEAGISSAVTITEAGWLLEVGIDKTVFDTPLPAVLGPANEGNHYGIEFSYRDNDDPEDLGERNGDTRFSSAYVWADGTPPGGGFPNKAASGWGQVIAAPSSCDPNTQGDLNADGTVNFSDFLILSTNFNSPATSHTDGDINCDGTVAFADFLVLSSNFNKQVGAQGTASVPQGTASVPEPSGITLLIIGGFAMLRARRLLSDAQLG